MAFSLPLQYARSIKQIEHTSLQLEASHRYIAWWYGGIQSNKNPAHVPLVNVYFRVLNRDDSLGNLTAARISLSALRQFQIGSVWSQKKSSELLEFVPRHFKVRFSGDQWENAVSVTTHRERTGLDLIPNAKYGLRFPTEDPSKLLVFEGPSGRLLIPCLEFFVRCYGHCEEINRILATHPWLDVIDYFDLDAPVTSRKGEWSIKLPYFARHSDSHLLAHLRYDEFTRRRAPRIQSDLDHQLHGASSSQKGSTPIEAFPTIGPWFEGDAEMDVEGIPLDNGDFLGLRITGYSVPSKPPIHCEVDKVESTAPEEGGGGGRKRPSSGAVDVPDDETTPTTDDRVPRRGSKAVIIKDPSIHLLGIPAPVTIFRRTKEGNGGSPPPPLKDPKESAPGGRSGSGSDVGRAYFTSQAVLDSDGAIRDLWNGLVHLKNTYPGAITSVNWFTFAEGLSGGSTPPKLVSLQFEKKKEDDVELSVAAENWIKFDAKIADKMRGVMIVRVTAPGKDVCLFEVQRKLIHSRRDDEEEEATAKEQSYCGLIIDTPEGAMESWIPSVLFEIAQQRGIMKKVLPRLSNQNGNDYRRSPSKSDIVVGESTARLALRKIGINVPRSAGPKIDTEGK